MISLPDTAPRYVLFLLIILFPIALFLAWAFDIRPTDGEKAARESAMKGFLHTHDRSHHPLIQRRHLHGLLVQSLECFRIERL